MSDNKLLLICYAFPPHPGIGGRRWAKFAKALVHNNFDVFVVNACNVFDAQSPWLKDVNTSQIKIHSWRFRFQKILKNPSGILGKIARKLIVTLSNQTRYMPGIITSYPNKKIWQEVKNLIVKEGIKKVIVSGDPFLFYYVSLLKKHTGFDLVLDYRDLWNDHSYYSAHMKLTARQKSYFEEAENYAVNHCDKIIFVDEHLQSVIKNRVNSAGVKTSVIYNGFDKQDFIARETVKPENSQIKIFFAGSIASDLDGLLCAFAKAFSNLASREHVIYKLFSVNVFGRMNEQLVEKISDLGMTDFTIENRELDMRAYYERLAQSDIGIVILSEEYKNAFITKFTDYLYCNKFIISIGPRGGFARYIEANGIGLAFDPQNPGDFFEKLLPSFKNKKIISPEEKNKFDLSHLTARLIKEVLYN